MAYYLGIDTSNYTTSAALYDPQGDTLRHVRRPLPVKKGERGLRQADALFHHTKALPELLEELFSGEKKPIAAAAASVRPRDVKGSYMPCFLAGEAAARAVAAAGGISFLPFSHQAGHIAAALYSASRLDLAEKEFLVFHVSGGTTELVLVRPDPDFIFSVSVIGGTLDANAGQIIDRTGVSMGFAFPAGKALDGLAQKAGGAPALKTSVNGTWFNLSGLENLAQTLLGRGESKEIVSLALFGAIADSLAKAASQARKEYGDLPLLFAGGVMSSSVIRERINRSFECVFAKPEFSSDNAAGVAVLAAIKEGKIKDRTKV